MDISKLKIIPLVYALFIRYSMALDDSFTPFEVSPDPMRDEVRALVSTIEAGNRECSLEGAEKLLSNTKIFGFDVTSTPLYDSVIKDLRGMLEKGGVRKTIHSAVS